MDGTSARRLPKIRMLPSISTTHMPRSAELSGVTSPNPTVENTVMTKYCVSRPVCVRESVGVFQSGRAGDQDADHDAPRNQQTLLTCATQARK